MFKENAPPTQFQTNLSSSSDDHTAQGYIDNDKDSVDTTHADGMVKLLLDASNQHDASDWMRLWPLKSMQTKKWKKVFNLAKFPAEKAFILLFSQQFPW